MEPRAQEPSRPDHGGPGPARSSVGPPSPAQTSRRGRRGVVRVTSAAAVALGLVVAGGSVAYASTGGSAPPGQLAPGAGGPHARPAAVGTVKSVGASSFVLTTHAGTQVTVDVTGQTIYRDPKVTTPSLSDVTPGAHVAVLGTTSSSTVTATTVLVGLPPRPGPGGPHARPAAGAVGAATA